MAEHSIVPARVPEDAEDFVRLFVISSPEYVPALFAGTQDKVAAHCFRHKRNISSFEHTHFVKVNGVNAGMIVAYDWIVNKGATELELDAETYNEGAIRFYQRFGMKTVGEPRGTVIAGQQFEFIRLSKDIGAK